MMMPVMDGGELASAMRGSETYRQHADRHDDVAAVGRSATRRPLQCDIEEAVYARIAVENLALLFGEASDPTSE